MHIICVGGIKPIHNYYRATIVQQIQRGAQDLCARVVQCHAGHGVVVVGDEPDAEYVLLGQPGYLSHFTDYEEVDFLMINKLNAWKIFGLWRTVGSWTHT